MTMEATVTLLRKMAFDAVSGSGHHQLMDAESHVGGENRGPRPMEFILRGLLGCTAMDVISILRKKRQTVTGFEVKGFAERADQHPKVFTHITIEYHVVGKGVEEKAVRRSIELSAVRYCPAQAMLKDVVPMRLLYYIYEDTPDGPELRIQGEWTPPEQAV